MKRKYQATLAIAGLLMLSAGGYFWRQSALGVPASALPEQTGANVGQRTQQGQPGQPNLENAVIVETTAVVRFVFVDEVIAVGTLKSNESVVLRPEVSGRVAAVHFKDGDQVAGGHLLFSLDSGVQRAELRQAEAQLSLARANQRRNADLYQKKFISQQALDNGQATLEAQEANVALASARFEKTRIRAPFSGTLGIRQISPGDYVKEGVDLVNLEDMSALKLDFRLPEIYLRQLHPGLALEAAVDALPGDSFAAVLTAINPLVDESGRSVACRALLNNSEGKLRPGMFARVRLALGESGAALAIPEEAVITGAIPQAFKVENGLARIVSLRLGRRGAGKVEVLEGLSEGDIVMTSGQLKARDGMAVREVGKEAGKNQ